MIVSSPNVGPDLNRFGPISLVVVQSTSLCNLDCSYCYLPDRQEKRVFDLDLLPLLKQRILESPYAGSEFALVWHAGEPLTLPTSWYDEGTVILHRSLEQFNAQGLDFTQHVQTNAIAMKGIEALHRDDVPFHSISVVTADAMEQPERMYRSFRDNGINDVGFNVEEQEGSTPAPQ